MNAKSQLLDYVLHLADNGLILGQRLGEWCGHGPVLEQDIALTNISLDLIGQARMLYQYAADLKGDDSTEDTLAMMRLQHEYFNVLLVEQPNNNWGDTIMRQFLFDVFNYLNFSALRKSQDETLAAVAERSFKEVSYHLKFSSEWVIRLGDGTEESHDKMQTAINRLWKYSGELYTPVSRESQLSGLGIAPDLNELKPFYEEKVKSVLTKATLSIPDVPVMQIGGKTGNHTEYLGHILSDLQYMQRAYPGLEW